MFTYKDLDKWYHKLEKELSDFHNRTEAKEFEGLVHDKATTDPDVPVDVGVLEAMVALERSLLVRISGVGTPRAQQKC